MAKKKLTKKEMTNVKANDIHTCPQGERWSDALQKCVPDPKVNEVKEL